MHGLATSVYNDKNIPFENEALLVLPSCLVNFLVDMTNITIGGQNLIKPISIWHIKI